jgi:multicomponent Na+:H+ antiporter subunit E
MDGVSTGSRLQPQALGVRILLAAVGWWVISEGDPAALWAGVPAVIAAVALSLLLAPVQHFRINPLGLLFFLAYFVSRSLAAGVDVAGRILSPRLRIDPVLVRVPLVFSEGAPGWLLASTLSLLPGTLSVALENETLVLHCLGRSDDIGAEVHAVERQVARVFGIRPEMIS